MRGNALVDHAVALLHVLVKRLGIVVREIGVPIAAHVHAAGRDVEGEAVRGRQLVHAGEECLVRGGELHGEVRAQGLLVHGLLKAGMLEETLDLAAEQQIAVGGLIVVERLDAEDVTRAKELAGAHVVHHEAVHATQAIDQTLSPLLIAVHEDLGVGVAVERVPRGLELGAELLKVVDLAVEHHEDRAVLVAHGLGASLGEVENGQAAETQRHAIFDMGSAHVGTAVDNAIHHRLENALVVLNMAGKTYESAHGQTFLAQFP